MGDVIKRLFDVVEVGCFFFQRFVFVFDQLFCCAQFHAEGVEHFLRDSLGILLLASLLVLAIVAGIQATASGIGFNHFSISSFDNLRSCGFFVVSS